VLVLSEAEPLVVVAGLYAVSVITVTILLLTPRKQGGGISGRRLDIFWVTCYLGQKRSTPPS